jgi:hypothetical protein
MLTLHFAPNSRASRIYWLLKELGIPFELNRMDFHPKELVRADAQEFAVRRTTAETGVVVTHFPRTGFALES